MRDLVADARLRVDGINPTDAHRAMGRGDVIFDVREPAELESEGAIEGAVHIPRGLVEAQADPTPAWRTRLWPRSAMARAVFTLSVRPRRERGPCRRQPAPDGLWHHRDRRRSGGLEKGEPAASRLTLIQALARCFPGLGWERRNPFNDGVSL